MTGHIVIRSSQISQSRQQPLLPETATPPATPTPPRTLQTPSSNVGEVAGGTAAGCFVVCCCCPCVLFECLVLAVYKVPAGIYRRILRKRRQKKLIKKKKGLLHQTAAAAASTESSGDRGFHHPSYSDELSDVDFKEFETVKVSIDKSAAAVELDKQMWDQFNTTGFWRSPSQRHT